MSSSSWGLLGPETLVSKRRTRTLGLGRAVRAFNDLAVPGMGGVWFGKQLLLATLGVKVAEDLRAQGNQVQNIEMANSIEALACWTALRKNKWAPDARLRGATKMRWREKADLEFRRVRKASFYVSQPMRMSTVQPLKDLGLVSSTSQRFNAYASTESGRRFLEAAAPKAARTLERWAKGTSHGLFSGAVPMALSPLVDLSNGAREILSEQLVRGDDEGARRRRNALAWLDELRAATTEPVDWADRPTHVGGNHWKDMHAGSRFFRTRDAAIHVLDTTEVELGQRSKPTLSRGPKLPQQIRQALNELRDMANRFLVLKHDPTSGDAGAFCHMCSRSDAWRVLTSLVNRDTRVLRMKGDKIGAGPAFRGSDVKGEDESAAEDPPEPSEVEPGRMPYSHLPPGISRRVSNMYLLNLDLRAELGSWMHGATDGRDDG